MIEKYIFIVTYGRSGSTLLQTVLQSIPGCHFRGENNNALFPLFDSVRRVQQAKVDHGYREIEPFGPWYGIDQVDSERLATGLVETFQREVLRPPEGTRILGFKEIRFHEAGEHLESYLNFIAEHMAPAHFIFNHRNWKDVKQSGWWKNCSEELVYNLVSEADAMYHAYAAKYPDRSLTMHYEHFKDDPGSFEKLFEFIGEPFDLEKARTAAQKRLRH